jgi:hypothetical protein
MEMPNLVIELQEGFKNDTVEILVDGREVFQKEGVRTDYTIGYADRAEWEGPSGMITVEVNLPQIDLTASIEVDVQKTKYLSVKVQEGRIEFKESDEMFYYF